MAVIGYLGTDADNGISFEVSEEVFRSPNNMIWSGSAQYSTHKRHATHALTEFTGLDPDSFTFDMLLTSELGVDPLEESVKLWTFERDAEPLGLVIGGKAYGKYRWTIKQHKIKIKYTDRAGDMYVVEVSVTLQEYLKGEDHNTTSASAAADTAQATAETVTSGGDASGGTSYTVKKGDCLWNIAKKFYGSGASWGKIYDANRSVIGGNPSLIYPGQVFTIPA